MNKLVTFSTHEEWLNDRVIGASDVSALLHLDPWRSEYTLYQRLRGDERTTQEESLAMRLGHLLEPIIDRLYREETGEDTWDPGDYAVCHYPGLPELSCTPDRLVGDGKVVELKSCGKLNDDALLRYKVQVQAQMLCLGIDQGAIAVLESNRRFHVETVPPYPGVQEMILHAAREMVRRVREGDPPSIDGSDSTTETLRRLHPMDTGETVLLEQGGVELVQAWRDAKALHDEHALVLKALENELRVLLGDNTFGAGPEFRVSYRTQTRKPKIAVDAALKELLDEAGIPYKFAPESTYRVLRYIEEKQEEEVVNA